MPGCGLAELVLGYTPRCILLVGAGGGGDVASTIVPGTVFEACGSRVVYASIVWERFVRDPELGPIPLEQLHGMVTHGAWSSTAQGRCWAWRRGRLVEASACRFSEALRRPVVLLDASRGALGVRLGIEEASGLYGCDAVAAVDVGGDIVAEGCEEELWSPLADSITLAAVASASSHGLLVVYAPGADGELPAWKVLERIGRLREALLWAFGLPARLAGVVRRVVEAVGTEAGRVPLEVLERGAGRLAIRGGARVVEATVVQTLAFLLDARGAYERLPLPRLVAGTSSVWEARRRLNEAGVYTELDLEEDVSHLASLGVEAGPRVLEEVRARGRKRLGWRPC